MKNSKNILQLATRILQCRCLNLTSPSLNTTPYQNMEQHLIQFSGSEFKLPILGFGTWNSSQVPDDLEQALNTALEVGYRHIDTAFHYQNEDIIGNVLKKWFDSGRISRADISVTSKLPPNGMKKNLVSKFLDESLKRLQLEYLDLYLIHAPLGVHLHSMNDVFTLIDGKIDVDMDTDLEAVWRGMEEQFKLGKVRAIGVANFNSKLLKDLCQTANIKPSNLQVELNLYLQERELRKYCNEHQITVTAYAPLGTPKGKPLLTKLKVTKDTHPSLLEDELVLDLAQKYNKTTAQILLRFLTQLGVSVIPKSANPVRIRENANIFDFKISPEDFLLLEHKDRGAKGRRFNLSKFEGFENHPLNPHVVTPGSEES